ncbi:hypothetical protein GIB67_021339 [Kingdonia uniflora]|uniref:Uncharacterized protein n=1 Tax=Kingdonia uniflora TaxID=39325 RepID=A0A7J7N382_9MAGN|nr:hypothetical protein GIB67_021339 [Kingdonia uniflora]
MDEKGAMDECIGDFGASLCSVIACLCGNVRESIVPFDTENRDDGLIVYDNRFRRVRDVDLKNDFAFVDFSDPRDADDARHNLDGRDFSGSRLIVEFAKGGPRGSGGPREFRGSRDSRDSRDFSSRGAPPPGSGRCFNCGLEGHWARDCTAGDWRNKCYRCGERGHIERSCQNSPKSLK